MYANPRPSMTLCMFACTARMARRKKTTIVVCLTLFILAIVPPLLHLGVLAACGAASLPAAICQFATRLGLGQGALIPGLAASVIAATAAIAGFWCARNVFCAGRERRHLLAEVPTGR